MMKKHHYLSARLTEKSWNMPSIRDVARQAGVSPGTVSRVLNHSLKVKKDTYDRIIKAARQLHYPLPEQPEEANRYHFGIVLPKMYADGYDDHPTIYAIMASFMETLSSCEASSTLLLFSDEDIHNIAGALGSGLDGYLVMGTSPAQEEALINHFCDHGIHYVIINRRISHRHVNYVCMDDVRAAYECTEHLIRLGHENIAYIGGNENLRHTQLRQRGYVQAMEHYRLPLREETIFHGEYSELSGYLLGKKLLALPNPPTAAVAAADILALGLQRSLREQGLTLPNDFATVSFGNIERSLSADPSLTTIDVPTESMGVLGAETLLKLCRDGSRIHSIQILLNADLVVRESSGGMRTAAL